MAEAWHIARSTRTCAVTGEEIPPEIPYYSAILEAEEEGWTRRDYSAGAWPAVEKTEFFSYWKNKGYSARRDKRPPVDYDRVLDFFDALEGAEERGKRLLRYVIALVLVRRRRLRLDDMGRTEKGEDRLLVYDRRREGVLEILSPEATREDLAKTQEQLNYLFDSDFSADV